MVLDSDNAFNGTHGRVGKLPVSAHNVVDLDPTSGAT
jgi:hypothetical protein